MDFILSKIISRSRNDHGPNVDTLEHLSIDHRTAIDPQQIEFFDDLNGVAIVVRPQNCFIKFNPYWLLDIYTYLFCKGQDNGRISYQLADRHRLMCVMCIDRHIRCIFFIFIFIFCWCCFGHSAKFVLRIYFKYSSSFFSL